MIALARLKAQHSEQAVEFLEMDAAFPQLPLGRFDALVCRHLLWALPDPAAVLQRWTGLLKPGGRLLLIEGYWHTGGGLHSAEVKRALPPFLVNISVQDLSRQPELWGGPVDDERYALRADLAGSLTGK